MVLRISGLASGMDIDSIVEKLMAAQRAPVDKLNQQKQIFEWQRDGYRDMNTKIYDFRNNKLSNYRLEGTWLVKKVDLIGNSAAITAKATGNAQVGTLTVQVGSLATSAANHSDSDIRLDPTFDPSKPLASQTGKIGAYTSNTFTINGTTITIEADDSLNDVIAKINKNTNVSAYYDATTGQVAFISKQTGTVNNPTDATSEGGKYITFSGDFLTSALKVTTASASATAASNASVTVNGLTTSSQSNTMTVNGVQITLNQAGGPVTTLNVSTDTDAIVDTIKRFISDYNDMLKTLQDKVNEKRYRDFPPLTDAQKKDMKDNEITLWEEKAKSGLLRNDEILTKAINSMRMTISTPVETGSTKYKTLSSIGIVTGDYTENGKLYLADEDKLRAAIEADPDAIKNLFAATGTDQEGRSDVGIAKKMYDDLQKVMDSITQKAGSPLLDNTYQDNSIIGKQLYQLSKAIDDENDRLNDIEDRYYRQFTAMESAINRYNAQAMYLQNAFGGSN